MADAAAKLSIFKCNMPDKMPRFILLGCTALAATFFISGPAGRLSLTVPAYADSLQHPTGFADVVKKVKPAVIAVRVKIDSGPVTTDDGLSDESPLERFFRRFGLPGENDGSSAPRGRNVITGQGSGFFISADGYAVTNGHVVDKASMVEVTTDGGRTHTAKVIGIDSRSDVALIKVDGGNFPFVSFSETSPQIGDWVLAVGNPFGLGGTVTAGIVSGRGRDLGAGPYDDFIQIDAPVNRGNSGGPAFDMDGNVIGVTTAIVSPSGGSVGIGFAIPAGTAKAVITQLREKGTVTRGWIGVQIQSVTEDIAEGLGLKEARGALVAEPQADGPAAKAGIESGDVITVVNGKDISDSRDLARTISGMSPGTASHITVMRKGQEKTFNVMAGTLPEQREANAAPEAPRQSGTNVPELGITVTPQRSGNGVAVSKVDPDGTAADRGVKNGDVILEAAGRKVATAADLRNAIDAAQKSGRHSLVLHLKSGNATKFVAVPVGGA
jgi:serine protease Do